MVVNLLVQKRILSLKYLFIVVLQLVLFSSCNDTIKKDEKANVKALSDKIIKEPKNAQLYYERGLAYAKEKKDTAAIEDLAKAIELDSTKAKYYKTAGDILYRNKSYAASMGFFQKASGLDPGDTDNQLKLANMFYLTKVYPKAFHTINVVLRKDPYNYDAFFLKGLVYKDMLDTANAILSFQSAAQLKPEVQDAYMQLAFITANKNTDLAKQYFMNAYKADTNNMEPLNGVGLLYQAKGDNAEAKKVFTDIIVRSMNYEKAYYNMGCVLMDEDSMEKASRQFSYAIKNKPDYVDAYFNRGLCYEKLARRDEAIADYKSCLQLDDSYQLAIDAMKKLGVALPK
jgi:tetratricopeptide (TPR) repeat protein